MDASSNEQTEILRNIWQQMVAMDRNLGGRIDGLGGKIDETNNKRLDQLTERLTVNVERAHRNVERIDVRLERIEGTLAISVARYGELDSRLATVEAHLGLRRP
jgi:hypothetical protein